MRHTDGRSRDIYGAWGWGKTHSNLFISIISEPPVTLLRINEWVILHMQVSSLHGILYSRLKAIILNIVDN